MTIIMRLIAALSSFCIMHAAFAEVYKCTDAAGEVVFQGEPCRQGEQVKLDIRFSRQPQQDVDNVISGSWCEIGTSTVPDGTVQRDNALRKTWIFSEHQMVQHVSQDQRLDTFKYPIRQAPGSFVINHPAFGSGQVSWQVKKLTEQHLILAAYGGFTHLTAGDCEMVLAGTKN
jgi:hypothetical protein